MDLRIFVPKTPVNLSAQIQRDVMNNEFSGATLTSKQGDKRRYFTTGFSIDDLEELGITDSTQLSQFRSMDDAGSIDLVTFESDSENIGFILTSDLHNVIEHATDDIGILKDAAWTIFEIINPLSETPFEGSMQALKRTNGETYKVPFNDIPMYFEHVMETGELMPASFMKGEASMSNNNQNYSDEELQALINKKDNGSTNTIDMTIEKKQSAEDQMYDDGEEYYQAQLVRENEERRRKDEENRRRAEADRRQRELAKQKQLHAVKQQGSAKKGVVEIPPLKPFDQILKDLDISPDTDIQRYYMAKLDSLAGFTDDMNIDADIFNSFDNQGRRDLMIAMNREREKLVNQALSQLKREAMNVEEQVSVDSEEANASVREKHMELYVKPVEERQTQIREQLNAFMDEREELLTAGFNDWWSRVQEDPEAVYNEIYNAKIVTEAVEKEKFRLSNEYDAFKQDRTDMLDEYISEFVEKRRVRDIDRLELDWNDGSRQGAQALSDRVDTARGQMDSRRMMNEMRQMHDQMEKTMTSRLDEARYKPINDDYNQLSSTSRQEGTIQQEKPEPRVQAPAAPVKPVERPMPTPAPEPVEPEVQQAPPAPKAVPVPEPVEEDEVLDDTDIIDDTEYEDDVPEAPSTEPVINRPRDMYPRESVDSNTFEEVDDWGDSELVDDESDEYEDVDDDDYDDEDDSWDDEEDVEEKPRKKGIKALFGKR